MKERLLSLRWAGSEFQFEGPAYANERPPYDKDTETLMKLYKVDENLMLYGILHKTSGEFGTIRPFEWNS